MPVFACLVAGSQARSARRAVEWEGSMVCARRTDGREGAKGVVLDRKGAAADRGVAGEG